MSNQAAVALRGVTWGNERGFAPLRGTLEAWQTRRPGWGIEWDVRPLGEFAHASIQPLTEAYDLVVLDHPHIGEAAESGLIAPLDEIGPAGALAAQRQTIGQSYASYRWNRRSWAFAIDAACQVSARRADLVTPHDLPQRPTWNDVLDLARARRARGSGTVALPLTPVLSAMCFLTLAANSGAKPFATSEEIVSRPVGVHVLGLLAELVRHAHPSSFELGDVEALDLMSNSDEVGYIPLVFGYSNFSRPGYRMRSIAFEDLPDGGKGPSGGILGGAGLAISARSSHTNEAAEYAAWLASPAVQANEYVESGGQPAHLEAWDNPASDRVAGGFFSSTRATIDSSYLRPRYPGYIQLQDEMGEILRDALINHKEPEAVIRELDRRYQASVS